MIISVNWLRKFTQIDTSIGELAGVIGARLVEIENIAALGPRYAGVIIARIVDASPVEDSDHLSLTRIDDGGAAEGVERGDDGLVQVVCGAPNVREGMLVAWLPPGSTVPETFGDTEPFVLGARKLRGHVSNGMLASARELALFDDHEGILEIDKDVAPGTPFADAYALDDYLLDIENKSLTHRPDTFGVVGFAREVAAIAGKGFTSPAWLDDLAPACEAVTDPVALSAVIDNPALSPRYEVVALGGLDQAVRTPLEIQTYLARSGIRPISPIVDVTNYLMLLTGQPLHAFDYDKVVALGSTHIHVREGHDGETLALLDGRTITLTADDIVIAAGDTAIALAGAMGGSSTEIDASTSRIIIESASFNLYNLRRTGMRHGIFSEALTRFTKGQPAALTAPVLAEAVRMIETLCRATRISDVMDDYPERAAEPTLMLTADRVNDVLGTKFSTDDDAETLSGVGFAVTVEDETLGVTPPYWRTDIRIAEDVIEEIGRLNGYDSIEPRLPQRDFTAVTADAGQRLREAVRARLSADGANEVLTYSFVHGDLLRKAGQSPDDAYALANAISPDLQHYRLSLTPSLLDKVSPNLRQSYDEFGLFESGVTHDARAVNDDGLPVEFPRLAFTYAANAKRAAGRGPAFYTAKRYLEDMCAHLHLPAVTYRPLSENDTNDVAAAPFEPKRAAAVYADDTYLGVIGEYRRGVAAGFKLPVFAAGFEIALGPLGESARQFGAYVPLSRYPSSDADVTFSTAADVAYAELADTVARSIGELGHDGIRVTFTPRDIYRFEDGDGAGFTKNTTLRFTVVSYDVTLTKNQVTAIVTAVSSAAAAAVEAEII